MFLEKNFSDLEKDASDILYQCLRILPSLHPTDRLDIDDECKWILSTFIASQYLRTREQRDLLCAFIPKDVEVNNVDINSVHAQMICNSDILENLSKKIHDSFWIFARNTTDTPFWTSDNPVAFKTEDNRMWLKGPGIFDPGTYAVYPINSEYILYCHGYDRYPTFEKLDSCLSPVTLTEQMVEIENCAQVFMATRHIVSPLNNFSSAEEFWNNVKGLPDNWLH